MLLVAGILLSILAVAAFLFIAFAQGMSDRQVSNSEFWSAQWPVAVTLLLAIACFIARHFLHGKSISW